MAKKTIQFGVMYHLTGYGRDVWRRDFVALAKGGFNRVVLADYDLDLDAFAGAMEACAEHGLRGYCMAFGPAIFYNRCLKTVRSLSKYRSIGIDGQTLNFLNPFLPEARRATLVPELRRISRHLNGVNGMAGYFIDDTMDAESIVSYSPADAALFRRFLQDRYTDLTALNRAWGENFRSWSQVVPPRETITWRKGWQRKWRDWSEARQQWWLGWADDAVAALRQGPRGDQYELVLGDDWYSVRFGYDVAGGFTPAFAAKFDSFSYDYTQGVNYLDPKMNNIDRDIAVAHDLAGSKPTTVFLGAATKPDAPFLTAATILAHTKRCMKSKIAGIDYYVYRAKKGNYAYKNCLANHPNVFKEIAAFIRSNA